eukprot:1388833-Amorphochlora_amoeboformis.AAC.1
MTPIVRVRVNTNVKLTIDAARVSRVRIRVRVGWIRARGRASVPLVRKIIWTMGARDEVEVAD